MSDLPVGSRLSGLAWHGTAFADSGCCSVEDGRVEDVDYVTIRDYSELDEDENGDDAPIINDPGEAGEVLEQLARRFTHESSDDDWPTGGPWTL